MNPAAGEIKRRVSMEEALRYYGFEPGRGGVMLCPFHREDTPSFKAYPGEGGWHCYGCGEGGSVIDFVMKLYHLSFSQAVVRLDNDFRLGLTGKKLGSREIRRTASLLGEKERIERERGAAYDALLGRYALLDRALSRCIPSEKTACAYAGAMAKREYLWYALETLREQKERAVKDWKNR